MQSWTIDLTGVAADGNATQVYGPSCTAGTAVSTATPSQLVREPIGGDLGNVQVATDGTNGGVIELYDMNGAAAGANVSSLAAITDAQLDAAIAAGDAVCVWKQNVAATGLTPASAFKGKLMKGLVARWVSAGNCTLNITATGVLGRKRGGAVRA